MNKKVVPTHHLIKSMDQAKQAFTMLLEERQKNELIQGVYSFVEQLEKPEIDRILDQYPDLLQKYDLKELLSGETEIPTVNRQDMITAGIVSCLMTLISFSSDLTDDNYCVANHSSLNEDNLAWASIQYIISCISLKDFLKHLLLTIISITGTDYYKKFQHTIGDPNFGTEDLLKIKKDDTVNKHIDLMLWFALIRLFLESVYFYFNDHHPEKQLL